MKKFPINKNNIIIVIIALVLTATTVTGFIVNSQVKSARNGRKPYVATPEKIDELFPYDEKEAEAIDETAPLEEGETWAIYMYLNASNLELNGYSQLSSFVEYATGVSNKARAEEQSEITKERFAEFFATEDSNNVPMPISFFDADYVKGESPAIPEENHDASDYTWGSDLLDTFRQANFPDNVTFVVQPGGATAWRDVQVNPNRNRRFVKQGDEFVEVYDAPVTSMGDSDTLSDFLKFCKKNYPADHTMVILTDHGGAMKGFGWDYIFGEDNLTLKELTAAFDDAYGLDEENPPVDILYFNACLMSNADVINAMRGVSKYMIAGEEVGLSATDYYRTLADRMNEKPNMNPMQLGKALIDCYCEDIATTFGQLGAPMSTGMVLLDMTKAPKVYDAYADLAGKLLEDVADNPRLLAKLSRNVSESVSFAVDSYKVYNCTDLGLWVDELKELYPKDSMKIVRLIDDSVIYKRADGYLMPAQGISVYYPRYVESMPGLLWALDYIDEISYSEDISALYYYKIAGCLNDKYKDYLKEKGIKEPEPIDYGAMSKLRNSDITPTDESGNVKAKIDEALFPILTDVRYELCKVNESDDTVTYYGDDYFVGSDGGTGVQTQFEGKWVHIGGKPFYVNVINSYEDYFVYESPVIYNDCEYRLILQCDIDAEAGVDTFTILGLRSATEEAAKIDRNVIQLTPGSYITPIYYKSSSKGGKMEQINGPAVLYNVNTRIQDETIAKGKYRVRLLYENMRGEKVYSAPVFFEAK